MNFNPPQLPPFREFEPIGCTFIEDEGYVSYGASSGTEISALPWHEAVAVFALWWRARRDHYRRQAAIAEIKAHRSPPWPKRGPVKIRR